MKRRIVRQAGLDPALAKSRFLSRLSVLLSMTAAKSAPASAVALVGNVIAEKFRSNVQCNAQILGEELRQVGCLSFRDSTQWFDKDFAPVTATSSA
ncbi:MAG TPA: hypothetical protein VKR55_22570 [Bradyrhizobium sp.]|uniref:hypothetical protein n=1 Tax=Bradyrhizobium sp. TaxID=376 RepID=UPI002C5E5147|nr:hypothetical protein [Bradyrhizobium sp.]HLZ04921.1 hypothetical protein [Bradyrhizobium sp.]